MNLRQAIAGLTMAASLAIGAGAEAGAGCCPAFAVNCGCETAMPVVAAPQFYLVNQGPEFTGPGHYLPRQIRDVAPFDYPHVGFVYSGYPYGDYGLPGYPRGFYSPYTGFPYAEPP